MYLYEWYFHLRRRCDVGMAVGPFTWADLHHWQSFTRRRLYPFELQIFEKLDETLLAANAKK